MALHVYRFNGAWAVQKDGERAELFDTRREAFATAVSRGKKEKPARVVLHGKDGRILGHREFGLPKIQDPPKKGRLDPRRISAAVGKVVLDRLLAYPLPPRAHASSK